MLLTTAQRTALKTVYDRQPLFNQDASLGFESVPAAAIPIKQSRMTYRQFRRTIQPEICGPAIMVPWCGMWLGIERDGYTHS